MATIYLIRHGMNDLVGKALAGWSPGVHLNEEGVRQAGLLAEELRPIRFAAVYSSPLERAVETAEAVAGVQGLSVDIRERLGEVRYGEWTGKRLTEVENDPRWRRWNEHRGEARCPGGESMGEIQARMVSECVEIAMQHPGQNVSVVSHGDPIRAALAHFLGMPLAMVLRLEIDPAAVSVVDVEEWGVKVHRMNSRG